MSFKQVGWILRTGHGDKFVTHKPHPMMVDFWVPVYINEAEAIHIVKTARENMGDCVDNSHINTGGWKALSSDSAEYAEIFKMVKLGVLRPYKTTTNQRTFICHYMLDGIEYRITDHNVEYRPTDGLHVGIDNPEQRKYNRRRTDKNV